MVVNIGGEAADRRHEPIFNGYTFSFRRRVLLALSEDLGNLIPLVGRNEFAYRYARNK